MGFNNPTMLSFGTDIVTEKRGVLRAWRGRGRGRGILL